MMHRLFTLLFIATLTTPAYAQFNVGAVQDGHNTANAARHLPTYLGDHFRKFQISIFNPYASIGSNFASGHDAGDYFTADQITSQMIGNTIDKLKKNDENNINALVDLAILNVAFNFTNHDGRKALSLGFGVNERVEANTVFNRETFLLAYSGNKQFANQTVSIAPRFNALAYTEYYASAAFNIRPANSEMVIKPAIRLSYLSGQASVYMPKTSSITLYTEPEGRYLDFGFNYTINTSVGDDSVKLSASSFNVNDKNFRQGAGTGFGMDLGLRISPKPGLLINVGVMDIGSIRFKKNAVNMYNYSNVRYEGQNITFTEDQSINLDSLAGIAEPKYSYDAYSVHLPTKFVATGSLGLGRGESKGGPWYKHQICVTYLQGFENYLSATKTPYVGIGYTHSFNNVFNLGTNVGVGGVWGASVGLLASLKAGPFNIGFNTNNIITLLSPKSGKGTDAAMMLVLAF
jgi:hypothetical protein